MPSLLDNIDRFSYTAQQIQSTSKTIRTNTKSGCFSRAVLQLPLGDRARDIDASELGLFTLVSQPAATAQPGAADNEDAPPPVVGEIARAEIPAATPLRKPTGGRTANGLREKEKEKPPEVYVEAALKYLDRYDSIRPMPRARQEINAIIERLNALRSDIDSMNAVVDQNSQDGSAQSTIKEEEKRIQHLQTRIKQLKARKDVLAQKRLLPKKSPSTAPDSQEEEFWGASHSRPRHSLVIQDNDESLLMDAEMDMGDVSLGTISEMPTPVPSQPKPTLVPSSRSAGSQEIRSNSQIFATRLSEGKPVFDLPPGADISINLEADDSILDDSMLEESETTFDEDAEDTVILSKASPTEPKLPLRHESPAPRPETPPTVESKARTTPTPTEVRPVTPARSTSQTNAATPATARKSRHRITSDTERIVTKIWSTVGDLIMPGHPFNTAAAATTNKPPRAKETIALLENVASKLPPQSSPSTHSLSSFSLTSADPPSASNPNAQQILTAHLLYTLLTTTESYSMPLNKAKEALSARGLGGPALGAGVSSLALGIVGTSGQAVETRALYGCIAKRLLKIDRSGREQVLKFDV